MDLPTFEDLMLPCLKLSTNGMKIRESVNRLVSIFNLTEEQVQLKTPKNRTDVFYGRVNWAITYLKMAGLVDRPSRGYFVITELGKNILEKNEERNSNVESKKRQRKRTTHLYLTLSGFGLLHLDMAPVL